MSADKNLSPPQLKRTDFTDCFECKVTGSLGAFALGCYMLYNSTKARNPTKNMRIFWRAMSIGAFYISSARVLYLPPFSSLKNRPLIMDVAGMKKE
uniref:DUF4536 domain-containing protein n=1 Tax=Panagrolaimus superbus TaxID=310955 RepID=A0A914Z499_9BILA